MNTVKWTGIAVLLAAWLMVITGCISTRGSSSQPLNRASYHYQMGLSYLAERNYTSALIELTEAERLDSDNPDVLYNLGMAYIGKKRPELSVPQFLRALELKPTFSTARNDLGVAYMELKQWDNAIRQFRIAREDLFNENSESASINLGLAYLGKEEYGKAAEELQGVALQNPRNPVARLSLGRVWFATGNSEKAIIEYGRALEMFPDYGAAHYHKGLAELKMNRIGAARDSFREAARLIPDTEYGRSAAGYLDFLK